MASAASRSTLALLAAAATCQTQPPVPPMRFSAQIETISHQLNATSEYPPYRRHMTVYFDFDMRRSRIDYDAVTHMPPKSFVRRYDLGIEWMVTELDSSKECHKSRLREAMPMPRFPDNLIYLGESLVRGQPCHHWREDLGEETVELFETKDTRQPLRLTTELVESHGPVRATKPLMTYDILDFEQSAPAEEAFKLKASSESPIFTTVDVLALEECERVVQDIGFPYIHFFHSYYYT